MKRLVLLFAALLVAGCGEKSLSDPAIKKALKEAVEYESLQERNDLYYQVNESKPFSGWSKMMYDSGQARELARLKDGKPDGPLIAWHENGQKQGEATYKDGKPDGPVTTWYENGQKQVEVTYKAAKPDGPVTAWHENGQKQAEVIYNDGQEVHAKFWNSEGLAVETEREAKGEQENSEIEKLREALRSLQD